MEKKSNHFSGQLGFVLAAAGSAVGVGNLWRFPYLAAKDGGGLFLIIYLILVLTFGFTLLTSDIAIGRRTQKSAIEAYTQMHPRWKFLGILTFLVPVLIMTYYAVIGGWITKYAVVYITGQAQAAAADDYFTAFITSSTSPVIFALLFMGVTAFIVYNGVEKGIEKVSKWMMPVLLVLVVVIAVYSLTISHTDASGQLPRIIGRSKAIDQPSQCCFSSAGWPCQHNTLPFLDGEVDIPYTLPAVCILKGYIFQAYHMRTPPTTRKAAVAAVQIPSQM